MCIIYLREYILFIRNVKFVINKNMLGCRWALIERECLSEKYFLIFHIIDLNIFWNTWKIVSSCLVRPISNAAGVRQKIQILMGSIFADMVCETQETVLSNGNETKSIFLEMEAYILASHQFKYSKDPFSSIHRFFPRICDMTVKRNHFPGLVNPNTYTSARKVTPPPPLRYVSPSFISSAVHNSNTIFMGWQTVYWARSQLVLWPKICATLYKYIFRGKRRISNKTQCSRSTQINFNLLYIFLVFLFLTIFNIYWEINQIKCWKRQPMRNSFQFTNEWNSEIMPIFIHYSKCNVINILITV